MPYNGIPLGELDTRYVNVTGDTMTGTLEIDVPTTTAEALILKTTDDNATKNIFEMHDSSDNVLSSIDVRGVPSFNAGTDISNSFIGNDSGITTTTGEDNMAVGSESLSALTSGSYNIAVGTTCLPSLTEGSFNCGIGANSLARLTKGTFNIGIGYQAGQYNQLGSYNTCVGVNTHRGTSGNSFSYNVAIGYNAGYVNLGNSNIFIGYSAGRRQTAASSLLIIDNTSRASIAEEQTNAIFYGVMAAAPADQTLRINAVGLITEKLAFTQTDGNEYIDSLNDGYMDYRATTAHRIGDGTNQTSIAANGDVSFAGTAGFYPRVLNQSAAPAAGTGATQCDTGELIVWEDADNTETWLVYNRGGTVKGIKVENL